MRDNSDKFCQIKTTERKILKILYFFVSYFSTFVIICRCCLFVSLMSFNLEVPSGSVKEGNRTRNDTQNYCDSWCEMSGFRPKKMTFSQGWYPLPIYPPTHWVLLGGWVVKKTHKNPLL
jgi:hypothetical protein